MKNVLLNLRKLTPNARLSVLIILLSIFGKSLAQDITTNLVAKWSFSQSASDDGGVLGTATVSGASLTADRLNRVDSAYSFDGVDDYIEIADASSLNFENGESFTFALWFRCDPHTSNRIFISKGSGSPSFTLRMLPDGTLESFVRTSTSQDTRFNTTERYDDGEWHHAAFTITVGESSAIYVDGELSASLALNRTGDLNTGFNMRFGTFSLSIQQVMKGDLDDIYLFDRILSQGDIEALYNIEPLPFLSFLSTSPSNGSLDASLDTDIVFNADRAIDPAASVKVWGSYSGFVTGTGSVADSTFTFNPDANFLQGETVTVSLDDTFKAANGDTLQIDESLQFTVASEFSPEYPNTIFTSDSPIDAFTNGAANIVFGDMDEDGDIDAVGISPGESKVTLYSNDGTGVFTQTDIATDASSSTDVQVGDANNDGLLDVFVSYSSKIVIYQNQGSSTFSTESTIATSVSNRNLVLADIDADGAIDVLNFEYFGLNVSVIYGNGDGTFASNTTFFNSTAGGITGVVVGVINSGDFLPDVLIMRNNKTLSYLKNTGTRSFQPVNLPSFSNPNPGNWPQGIAHTSSIADINNDGLNDLVVGTYDPTTTEGNPSLLGYFLNVGNTSFSAFTSIATLAVSRASSNSQEINVSTADLDGDSDADLLVYANSGKISWFENLGDLEFSDRKEIGNYTPGQSRVNIPKAVDLTGDGVLDVAAFANNGFRYFANADILSVISYDPTKGEVDVPVDASISVTFDKEVDESTITTNTVITNGSKSNNLTGFGTTSYSNKVLTINFSKDFLQGEEISLILRNLVAADGSGFRNDTLKFSVFEPRVLAHYPSASALNPSDSIAIYYNSIVTTDQLDNNAITVHSKQYGLLDGVFDIQNDTIVVFKPTGGFSAADKLEVLSTIGEPYGFEFTAGSAMPGNAVTFSETQINASIGDEALFRIMMADADNDGDLDISVTDFDLRDLQYAENTNGYGAYSTLASTNVSSFGNNLFAITTADLDNDGVVEFVAADKQAFGSYGNIERFYQVSSSWQTQAVIEAAVFEPFNQMNSIQAADLDLDGKMELITSASGNGQYINIITLTASGTSSSERSLTLPSNEIIYQVFAYDINGDGAVEILCAMSSGLYYYNYDDLLDQNNFDATADRTQIFGSEVRKVIGGDIDGDGDGDLVIATSFASVTLGLNDGNGIFTTQKVDLNADEGTVDYIKLGDMDGDMDMDIVYSTARDGGYVGYLQNNGNLTFTDILLTQTLQTGYGIDLGDVDDDGDVDVVGVDYGGRVVLFKNLGIDNNLPPAIDNAVADLTLMEDAEELLIIADLNLVFSDPEQDEITYSVSSDTIAVVTTLVNDTTVSLSLEANYYGVAQVTVTATDANGGATDMTVTVTVTSINDVPTVVNPLTEFSIVEDQGQGTINLANIFTDVEDAELTYTFTNTNTAINVSLDEPNQRLVIDAIPDAYGDGLVTITATDTENGTAINEIQFSVAAVNDAPGMSATNIVVDEDFATAQATVVSISQPTNESDQTISVSISPDPETIDWAMITFDDATYILEVTALADGFGSQVFTVNADDGQAENNIATLDVTITVNPINDAPTFELSRSEIVVGQNFVDTETITLTDLSPANETEAITYTISPASVTFANVSIDEMTGEVSVSAITDGAGSQVFTLTANDQSTTAEQQFTVEVLANQPPAIIGNIADQTFVEDAGNQVVVADVTTLFSDPDGDNLTYSVSSDNTSISAILNGQSLELTANTDYFGTSMVTLTASDAAFSTELIFAVTVTAINDAPVVVNPVVDQVATEDAPFSFQLPADIFSDVDNTNLSTDVDGIPTWLSFDGLSGFFVGTPTNVDVGSSTIIVTVSDGELTASDEFMINVENVNDAPSIATASEDIIVDEDAAVSTINVANVFEDIDAGDQLTITQTSDAPSLFTVVLTGESLEITYLANVSGTGIITLTATDGSGATATDDFTVTVNSVNDAPVFDLSSAAITAEENFTDVLTIDILVGAIPADETDQMVTYTLSSDDTDIVTATLNGTSIEISAIIDAFGEQTFTLTANDGQAENSEHVTTFTVTVNQVLSASDALENVLKIYPNPVTEYVMIDTNELVDVRFYGLNGQLIKELTQVNGKVNVSDLNQGTYLMDISNTEEKFTLRMTKKH